MTEPRSNEYWRKRFEGLTEALLNIGEEYLEEMELEYRRALSHLRRDIAYFYERFAEENEISLADARRILDSRELEEFQWTVEEYIAKGRQNAVSQRWLKELENASTRIRLSRLQSLEYQIKQEIELLAVKRVNGLTRVAKEIVQEGYYRSIYEVQKEFGISDAFNILDSDTVEKIIAKPWAPDGKDFSERIWEDRDRLVNELQRELTHSFIRGDSPDQAIKNIARSMNVSRKNAGRVVMTESAYFASVSRQEAYKQLNVKEYQISATLDLSTSKICQEMDRKIFKISEYEPGVTANPFHPRCRTSTVPYFEGGTKARAMRDPVTGKVEETDRDMSYKEWYQEYVVDRIGQEQADILQKKIKNKSQDVEQYKRYKKTLGQDLPAETFAEFQDLKYNKVDEWEQVKRDYRLLNLEKSKIDTPEKAREYIGLTNKTIHEGRQGKHILGHNNYIEGRSYLTIPIEEAQRLVEKHAGNGLLRFSRNGRWQNQEIIISDKLVGVAVNSITGETSPTMNFKIHYSKHGTHIVPIIGRE